MLPAMLDLAALRALYAARALSPVSLASALAERMTRADDPAIFITRLDEDALRQEAERLLQRAPEPNSLPLWGIPFAVKDNIDVSGLPTTAACPGFAYVPERDAFVVARLKAAGAIVVGKTNLDQFATGLNGTRSPYGAPRCVFDPDYVPGGSSSGSAVAVASGLATFALGTDTAGSGRVPAAFNNLVGIKPTPGRLSTTGVVPACRSLDVVSIFAGCVADGVTIRRIAEGCDRADPFSRLEPTRSIAQRPRIGILRPGDRAFYGDDATAALYESAIASLPGLDAEAVPFDYEPFRDTAALLYDGPWVAERLAALEGALAACDQDFDPTVRAIVESAGRFSAADAFRGLYRLQALRRQTERTWDDCDALLLPTAPTIYTVDAMRGDPVRLNSHLGAYTNFANLLGLAAIAVPAGFTPAGLAFGVTLVGPGSSDDALAPLADALHRQSRSGMGRARTTVGSKIAVAEQTNIELAVCGAHLTGMPLNRELTERGGRLVRTARTAADYRFYSLAATTPPKPGLVREPGFAGPGIELEIWSLPPDAFAEFVRTIPSPLGIARISLADGKEVQGFMCEQWAVADAVDITRFGGWREYRTRAAEPSPH